MNPNLSLFARHAAPGRPAPPGRAPAMGPQTPMARLAAAGRGGDEMVAHMTPGEIAVPPQAQTPEVLAALNRAFAQLGANPTSYQAGNPDQKINPETGMPEFGFFEAALPMALAVGATMVGAPYLAPVLMEAGLGATAASVAAPAILGGLGTTAGNLITGKPFDQAITNGALSGLGSGLGGALGAGAFGSGPSSATAVGPSAGAIDYGSAFPAGGSPASATASAAGEYGVGQSPGAEPKPNYFNGMMERLFSKESIGSGIGGMLGGSLADSMFPQAGAKPDLGPSMGPPKPLASIIGGGSPGLSGPVNAGAPAYPGAEYLRNYGRRPQFNYFPTA